jgi:hypothetical protein
MFGNSHSQASSNRPRMAGQIEPQTSPAENPFTPSSTKFRNTKRAPSREDRILRAIEKKGNEEVTEDFLVLILC